MINDYKGIASDKCLRNYKWNLDDIKHDAKFASCAVKVLSVMINIDLRIFAAR